VPYAATIFKPEDGGSMFLQNVIIRLQDYTMSQPRRPQSEIKTVFITLINMAFIVVLTHVKYKSCMGPIADALWCVE
jgi:hypothetical protein